MLVGEQLEVTKKYQRFVVARKTIEITDRLTPENIVVQRVVSPADSLLPASSYDAIIGKCVRKKIKSGNALHFSDIETEKS